MKLYMRPGALEVLIFGIVFLAACCSGKRPSNIGAPGGIFTACPSSPNCVSSQAPDTDTVHYIKPIQYTGTMADAHTRLTQITNSMTRAKIITSDEKYIHAEFTSALFRFVDDVEFFIDDSAKTIHFRSASRIGYGDMGVNRKRIEQVRSMFNKN